MRAIVLAVMMLGGCASGGGGYLAGGEWRAVDINGAPMVEGSQVTLRLEDKGRATGSAGCNSYTGGYALSSRQRIRFDAIASTRRACADALMEQERRYLAILGTVESHSAYGDGSLSLIAADGRAIRFRRRAAR